jgi:hypothetical protein
VHGRADAYLGGMIIMSASDPKQTFGRAIDVRFCAGLLAGHGADKVFISQGFTGRVQQGRKDV